MAFCFTAPFVSESVIDEVPNSLSRATTPLLKRLRAYLTGEARLSEAARSDLERLQQLCDCGEICVGGKPLAVGTRAERIAAVASA